MRGRCIMGDTTSTPVIAPEVSFQLLLGDYSPLEKEGWECRDVVALSKSDPDGPYDSGLRDRSCLKILGNKSCQETWKNKKTLGESCTALLYEQALWTDLKDGKSYIIKSDIGWSGSVSIQGEVRKVSIGDHDLNGRLDAGDFVGILRRNKKEEALRYRCDDKGQWIQTKGDEQVPLSAEEVAAIIDPVNVSYQSAVRAAGLPKITPAEGKKESEFKNPSLDYNENFYKDAHQKETQVNVPRIQLRLGDVSPLKAKDFSCKTYFEIEKSDDGKSYVGYQGPSCIKKGKLSGKVNEEWTEKLPESKILFQYLLRIGAQGGESRPQASTIEIGVEAFWYDVVRLPFIVQDDGATRWKYEERVVKVEDLNANGKIDGTDRLVVFQKKFLPNMEDNLDQAEQYRLDEDGRWLKTVKGRGKPLPSREEREFKRVLAKIEEKYQAASKEAGLIPLGD